MEKDQEAELNNNKSNIKPGYKPGWRSSKGSGSALWYSSVSLSTSSDILKNGGGGTWTAESHTDIREQLPTVYVKVLSLGQYVDQVLSVALLFSLPLLQQSCELCFRVHAAFDGRRHQVVCKRQRDMLYRQPEQFE